jgi:hypothetical protein
MTKDQVIPTAKREARAARVTIAIYFDPFTEDSTPYGYCPEPAVSILAKHATVCALVGPTGRMQEVEGAPW